MSGPKFSLTLFFSGHAGDRGLCSPGFSVVQCLRKAAVVLPGRQRIPQATKKKERFQKTFGQTAQTVVYNAPGIYKTSNSQAISYHLSVCHY